jgi:hypothetical protein
MGRRPMHMADWIQKLDAFLNQFNEQRHPHPRRTQVSHEMAQAKAELEYDKFKALAASAPAQWTRTSSRSQKI